MIHDSDAGRRARRATAGSGPVVPLAGEVGRPARDIDALADRLEKAERRIDCLEAENAQMRRTIADVKGGRP